MPDPDIRLDAQPGRAEPAPPKPVRRRLLTLVQDRLLALRSLALRCAGADLSLSCCRCGYPRLGPAHDEADRADLRARRKEAGEHPIELDEAGPRRLANRCGVESRM